MLLHCRQQDCLTSDVLGPARADCFEHIGNRTIQEGDIIVPPSNAASVSVENLRVKRVIVADKEPNPFKSGFWDITLKYVFVYTLAFRESDGTIIGKIQANSIYTKKVTLFGSIGTEISISTDLFNPNGSGCCELNSDPFVLVESKAVALGAELRYQNRQCCADEALDATEVGVTIGLFTIIKLFRLVNLSVLSRGFCIPKECENISPLNPCEFFDSLDFPMDIFAPPQKTEFLAGISGNIPNDNTNNNNNGCGCHTGCEHHNNCGCSCNNSCLLR
ncbi:hypothetical protein [uncultured Tyzzerella sp.]|uniref:hypothetical protein n=1 Tax=uncultured Tyzzerella sp. TaxID=2321398 RepID=UPI002942C502|nr:hypothetical protein [uncultured Tyzzerella sp.]